MSAQSETAVPDAPDETEPTQATEQPDYADALLKLAAEDGHTIGDEPPKDETEPDTLESEAPATEPETEVKSDEAEPEAEEETEEEKPAAKKDEWPDSAKTRVAEETAKRKRANERADKAEVLAQQLQEQLTKIIAPRPTEDDPFKDISDVNALDRLELSYEKAIDLADDNPDGAVDVLVGRNADGSEIRQDFAPEQLLAMRKKAEKAIRKFIPERRTYLQQRVVEDAKARETYPWLNDPESESMQLAANLAYRLSNGEAMKSPDILIWIADAVQGRMERLQRNGEDAGVKTPGAKRIVESARQKIAPTPTKSRSFVERGSGSVSLAKAAQKLEQRGDSDAAEEYVAALFSKKGGSKRLEPMAE